MDLINIFEVSNISTTLKYLKTKNFWVCAFDKNGAKDFTKHDWRGNNVLLFGSEGYGLKYQTLKNSDFLLKISINKKIESLNISNSAAVAFHFISNKKKIQNSFMKKLIQYIINYFSHNLEDKIVNLLKKEKKLVIFDVGLFRGIFSRKILHLIKKRKFKFYLFDVNKNTKRYISDLLLSKHFKFNEVALSNKNGMTEFNYNSFFESSGSSLSTLFKDDTKQVFSRKLILKILLQSTKDYIKYKVYTLHWINL